MNAPPRSLVPGADYHLEQLAPGVTFRRLHPGGMAGPNGETHNDLPGGQIWSEAFLLGTEDDDFIMCVPDIRLPPNQITPMHWHDCWTVIVVLEGKCLMGDWYMETGDAFVSAPGVEYGPIVPGPMGCRILEIFGDLALSAGGWAPEYRDHPTALGGNHVFKPREGANLKNEGHSSVPIDETEGLWKTRLVPGWQWDLGSPDDPKRGALRNTTLGAAETIGSRSRGDWYAALVIGGSAELAGRMLVRDDVLLVEPGSTVPELVAGKDGVQLLEHFRTARAL
jgi:hypothetical protein